MNENNGLQSSEMNTILDKIKKDGELIIVWGPILSVIFSFSLYVIRSLYFCRWGIDISFYSEDNVIYKLIYFLGCACFFCFIYFFLYKIINNSKLKIGKKVLNLFVGFLIFLFFSFFLSSNQLIERGFTIYNIILQFVCSVILYFAMMIIAKIKNTDNNIKEEDNNIKKNDNNIRQDIYNKYLNISVIIIPALVSIIAIGMIQTFFKKDYRIIETNQTNECSVVLYSTKDYFIVSECEMDEEKNKLTIYKGKVKKIDNVEIIANKRIFSAIEKK